MTAGLWLNGAEVSLPEGTELWFEGAKVWPADDTPPPVFNAATLDPAHRGSGITLSNGNLTARAAAFQNAVWATGAIAGDSIGCRYWEVTLDELPEDWYHVYPMLIDVAATGDPQYSAGEGWDINAAGVPDFVPGMVVSACLKDGALYFGTVAGGWLNGGNPDAGTGAIATLDSRLVAPGVGFLIVLAGAGQVTFNFGGSAWAGTPPTGATGWPAP